MAALNFIGRWLDLLASLVMAWRELWRARRTITVTQEGGRLVVRRPGDPEAVLAELSPGQKLPEEAGREVRGGVVVLRLAPERLLARRLTVPKQAREFLSGIIQNQIERLSPWKLDQATYGFSVEPVAPEAESLDVRVLIASRTALESARREAADAGLTVDRIVGRESPDEALDPVLLWSRVASAPQATLQRARLAVAGALLAVMVASFGTAAWAIASASSASEEAEQISGRVRTVQRQRQGGAAAASASAAERAWRWKQTSPAAVIVLEALSKALPDSAYLTELNLQASTLRIIGQTSDAPALIGALESSGHFTDVRFFAPTTRAADGSLFRFHIEARVQPRVELAAR